MGQLEAGTEAALSFRQTDLGLLGRAKLLLRGFDDFYEERVDGFDFFQCLPDRTEGILDAVADVVFGEEFRVELPGQEPRSLIRFKLKACFFDFGKLLNFLDGESSP